MEDLEKKVDKEQGNHGAGGDESGELNQEYHSTQDTPAYDPCTSCVEKLTGVAGSPCDGCPYDKE